MTSWVGITIGPREEIGQFSWFLIVESEHLLINRSGWEPKDRAQVQHHIYYGWAVWSGIGELCEPAILPSYYQTQFVMESDRPPSLLSKVSLKFVFVSFVFVSPLWDHLGGPCIFELNNTCPTLYARKCSGSWSVYMTSVNLLMLSHIYMYIYKKKRRCLWCNGYCRRKWTWRHEFKSWMRLIALRIALIPLGKVWIQLFSLQLWAGWVLQPWLGN